MKIKKIGHCCLVIKENGVKIMTDPGSWTIEEQQKEENIDLILITHEHGDHIHIQSLQNILKENPKIKVITNAGVGRLLEEANIKYQILPDKEIVEILGVKLEAHDCAHAEIFRENAIVQNTGFFIGGRLFYPGDAFYNPHKNIEILALPVAGPWLNVKQSIDYALEIKPDICFPVHDGMLKSFGANHRIAATILPENGINFESLEDINEIEL